MKDLEGKRLLLLGGPSLMCDVIDRAREMGVYTIVTDWYDPDVSVAKRRADEWWMVSSADVESICSLVREKNIDGVYTQYTDSALPYCQEICERCSLPFFLTADQVRRISNKRESKRLCQQYGIPVSREYTVTANMSPEELEAIEWPVLTKPTDNSGQRGITICHNAEELRSGYAYAMENSKEGGVIVEEYMQGDYVVLNFTLQGGRLYLSGMADKPVIDERFAGGMVRLPKGYIMPSRYLSLFYERRFDNFEALAQGLGLHDGSWSVECVVRDDDFYVFEMQFRLGGMRHYTFMQEENDIDLIGMHIRYALTGSFDGCNLAEVDTPYYRNTYCSINMLLKDGIITSVEGLEVLDELPEVRSWLPMHELGDKVELSGTVFQIYMKASIVASSRADLLRVLQVIQERIRVYDQHGNNMMLSLVDGFEESDECAVASSIK